MRSEYHPLAVRAAGRGVRFACQLVLQLMGLALISLVIAFGVYLGEYEADVHYYQYQVDRQAESIREGLKEQQDLIRKYEQEHPGSKPMTRDYPNSL